MATTEPTIAADELQEAQAEQLTENEQLANINADYDERYGFHDAEHYLYKAPKGINREIVEKISEFKSEPQWMRDFRLRALEHFFAKPQPTWGSPMLADVDYDDIHYFVRASERAERSWDDVPEDVKKTFDRLGIPEAERKFLAGVGAQYESEVVYHQINQELVAKGVIFTDMDTALREHEELVREYFATVIQPNDNKLAALNSSVWSGGSFVYVPKGVHVEMPLQAYFRINTESMGQFERTLIIADEGSYVHYVEGCTAPTYSSASLHSAVVELIAKPGARIRYTTVQNWSANVFNLVTKRAVAYEDATVEWVDCNLGSKLTMKYPSVYLMGERAHGEILSIAFAGRGQHQDAGGKIIHVAPNTTSNIFAKSISKDGGRGSYRGLLEIAKGAHGARSKVVCDALLLDETSRSDTYPTIRISEDDVNVGHEATVSKVGEDQLFYLMSHGIPEDEASKLIVNGFIEPITKELPMEYAVEMNRLIELQMEGSIG
jgi:Fe-S cluster assembly protein SufB